MRNNQTVTVFSSAARTASANSSAFHNPFGKGAVFHLNVSAASGTDPTLDVKIQRKDPVSGEWIDLPGAVFAQKVTTGNASLTVFPGVAETSNVSVSDVLGSWFRAVATIAGTATPSFTFTLSAELIQ